MSITAFSRSDPKAGSINFEVGKALFQRTDFSDNITSATIHYKKVAGSAGSELHYSLETTGKNPQIHIILRKEREHNAIHQYPFRAELLICTKSSPEAAMEDPITLGFKKSLSDLSLYTGTLLERDEHPMTTLSKILNHTRTTHIERMQDANMEDTLFYIRAVKFINDLMTLAAMAKSFHLRENDLLPNTHLRT